MAIRSGNKHQRIRLSIDESPANGPVPCTLPLMASRDVINAMPAAPIDTKRSALQMANGNFESEIC